MTNLQTIAMVLALLLGIVVVIKGVAEETTACPRNVSAWLMPGHCAK
jgi:hypothetical protein